MQVSDEEYTENGQSGAAAAGIGRKMYYSISEVCAMTGLEPHILRYWEKEFSLLRPKKNSGGKRAYKEKDIEAIVKIKRMLEEKKCTLHGAKDKLSDERRERRTGGNAVAKKRGNTGATTGRNGLASTEPPALESAAPSTLTPTNTAAGLTKRKVSTKSNGNDNALLFCVRGGLLEVLGLLES
jgi:DNA-binding transcriptional MerR regulator